MRKFKQFSISSLALILAIPTLVVAPVFAQHGADDSSSTSTSQSSDDSSTSTSGRNRVGTTPIKVEDDSANAEAAQEHATEFETEHGSTELHQRGKAMVAELEKDHQAKTPDQLKNECLKRKARFAVRSTGLVRASQRVQGHIDEILAKATAYQQTNSLSSDELASLLATANQAKATSTASVATLASLQPKLDCTSTENAANIATFKAAAQTAQTNLKAYRTATRAYIVALKAASPEAAKENN